MNRPLVWTAAAFIAGLWGAAEGAAPGYLVPIGLLAAGLGVGWIGKGLTSGRTLSVVLSFAGAGALCWTLHHQGPPGDALGRDVAESPRVLTLEGHVRHTGLILPDSDYTAFVLDAEAVRESVGSETSAMHEASGPLTGRVYVRWSDPGGPVFPGERVRVTGWTTAVLGRVNPGVQDIEDHLRRRGIHSTVRIQGESGVERLAPASRWSLTHWAARLRLHQALMLREAMPEAALPFTFTIWLGDRGLLHPESYQAYIESGTAHILAVSGIHVGIVYASLTGFLPLFVRNRKIRTACIIAGVFAFAVMAGARVSALRAALMVTVYLLALLLDREGDAPTALAIAAMLLLGMNPELLFDGSFQLSFLSVASILVFADRFQAHFERVPRLLRPGLSATLAVQILPLPAALRLFHVVPLAAPALNLLVVPLLAAALWLCFVTVVCAYLAPGVAALFGHAMYPVAWAIEQLAEAGASLPFAAWRLGAPVVFAGACYYAAVLTPIIGGLGSMRRRVALAIACAVMAAATWFGWNPEPKMVFLDVGDGDATFIRSPEGVTCLVDAGDRNPYVDTGMRTVAPFLWGEQVRRLDYAVATHPDRDHIGGFMYVLEHFEVGEMVLWPAKTNRALERELRAKCEERGVPVRRVAAGDTLELGGARLEVVHPPADWPESSAMNDRSLVMRYRWGEASILLPGDIERGAEEGLDPAAVQADVLKAPHHGRNTSSSSALLDAVSPAVVVVSGGNTFGHPGIAAPVARRIAQRGLRVWRTDQLGGITLRFEEGSLLLEGARQSRGYPVPADFQTPY